MEYTSWKQVYRDAYSISRGACNPIAVTNSLVGMMKFIMQDTNNSMDAVRGNYAIRLVMHQLAYLCGVPTNETMNDYECWVSTCKSESEAL